MSKSREVTSRAVIIGRTQVGDGSVRIFIYTEYGGLLTALAKSGREERSKLRPHLQVGTLGLFTFVRGLQGWRVIGAVDTQNVYFVLSEKEQLQKSVARVLGVVRQLVRGEERNDNLFDSLWNFLDIAVSLEDSLFKAAEHIAVLRIVAALGYVSMDENDLYTFSNTYDNEVLKSAHTQRKKIVHTINNALAVSGLS